MYTNYYLKCLKKVIRLKINDITLIFYFEIKISIFQLKYQINEE